MNFSVSRAAKFSNVKDSKFRIRSTRYLMEFLIYETMPWKNCRWQGLKKIKPTEMLIFRKQEQYPNF